jgi:hypothetical protein
MMEIFAVDGVPVRQEPFNSYGKNAIAGSDLLGARLSIAVQRRKECLSR